MVGLTPVTPLIDLFASKNNNKLEKYVSLVSDPGAVNRDAFSFTWPNYVYCFPPIPLIFKAVKKFFSDEVELGIFVTPAWPFLSCIPMLTDALIDFPILIHYSHILGCLPTRHPFPVMAWPISAKSAKRKGFQRRPLIASPEALLELRWPVTCDAGRNLVNGLLRKYIRVRLIHL